MEALTFQSFGLFGPKSHNPVDRDLAVLWVAAGWHGFEHFEPCQKWTEEYNKVVNLSI